MKRLFLCSEFYAVANHIFTHFLTDKTLRVLFIDTAAEAIPGEHPWVLKDRKAFKEAGFDVTDFTITGKLREEIKSAFDKCDVIYSTGGNVFHYLQQIQKSASYDLYRDAVENKEKIYIGGSAGSMITAPDISSRNFPGNDHNLGNVSDFTALNLVNFMILPHWGREDKKEQALKHRLPHDFAQKTGLIILTDDQYVRVVGDMYQIIDISTIK